MTVVPRDRRLASVVIGGLSALGLTAVVTTAGELASVHLIQWFERRATQQTASVALRFKDRAIWRDVTWRELAARVKRLALGLEVLGVGVKGRALCIGMNGPAWPAVELAVEALGASVCVSDARSISPGDLRELTERLAPHVVIASQVDDVEPLADLLEWRGIPLVIGVTSQRITLAGWPSTVALAEVEDLGLRVEAADDRWHRLVSERVPEDVIRIAATSGVDNAPRLVALSSRDVLLPWGEFFLSGEWADRPTTGDRTIALQPVARTSEFVLELVLPIVFGVIAHFPESADSRDIDMVEVSPTIVIASPRLWRIWSTSVVMDMRDAGWVKRAVFRRLQSARRYQLARRRSNALARIARALPVALWWLALRRPLLTKLGLAGTRTAVVSGASFPSSLLTTWHSWGVPLMETYGTAETSDLVAARPSWVDPAEPLTVLSGVELAGSGEGEITLRSGVGVSTSYLEVAGHESKGSQEFPTGDLGCVEGRQITILGRRADRVELLDGRSLALDRIEKKLVDSPYISAAVVVCRDLVHPTALLEISYRDVAQRARIAGVAFASYESLASSAFARQVCSELITEVNDSLRAQGIPAVSDFRVLLRRLSPALGELTSTRKVRRRRVAMQFDTVIEEMYSTIHPGKVMANARS